jgi:hypothetical protein
VLGYVSMSTLGNVWESGGPILKGEVKDKQALRFKCALANLGYENGSLDLPSSIYRYIQDIIIIKVS